MPCVSAGQLNALGASGHKHTLPQLGQLTKQRCSHSRLPRSAVAHATLLPAPVEQIVETATLAAVFGGIALSSLPLLTGEAKRRNAQRPSNEDVDDDNFMWTIMGFISSLPYADWTAWAFKAINDDDPAYYYGLAFLYALPWVLHDLRFDGYTILSLLLCAAHVQVERIAATEPIQVDIPLGSELAAMLQQLLTGATKPAQEVVKSAQRKQLNAGHYQRPPRQEEQDAEETDYVKDELRRWDRLFKERSREKEKDE